MTTEPPSSDLSLIDDAWRQIEALIDRIAELSKADVAEEEFYHSVLEGAVQTGAASGGIVWSLCNGEDPRPQLHVNADARLLAGDDQARRDHHAFLNSVLAAGEPRTAPARSGGQGQISNPTDNLLIACPVVVEGHVARIIEVLQRPDLSPDAQRSYVEVMTTLCDLAADYHRNDQLRRLRDREASWSQIERLSELVHDRLDLDATAYTLANEGRRLAGCDRMTVAVRKGAGYSVRAVSGLDTVDRRSNAIRGLEELTNRVAVTREPLWYTGDLKNLSPEIETAVQTYVDSAHARSIAVIPLDKRKTEQEPQSGEHPVGVLVFECFAAEPAVGAYRERVETVCRHGRVALANARSYDSIPLVRVLQKLRWFSDSRRLSKTALCLMVAIIAVAIPVLVPADFYIQCRGQLQPKVRRKVFAPVDGQVEQLSAEHGDEVAMGDVLATVRSSDLEFDYTRVLGEIQTTTEQLNAVKASRLSTNPTSAAERDEYARLTAEEERLKKLLDNLKQQEELLDQRRKELRIQSPIDGQVLTWEVTEMLQTRPVKRGQVLMTVADTEGPWLLEVQVPDKHSGYVQQAWEDMEGDVNVSFVLATDPGTTCVGKVERVAMISEPDELGNLSALITIAFDRTTVSGLHPGAGSIARIHCGRRCLGYVWLHDLIETVRAKLFI